MSNDKVVTLSRTYTAKRFAVGEFKVSGTLEGSIDLATPGKTFLLSLSDAKILATALLDAVSDVTANCLYDKDALLR